jgi:hypothetical protein
MKKKAGTKMVSYFMIYNKEPLLPITVSFLLPPTPVPPGTYGGAYTTRFTTIEFPSFLCYAFHRETGEKG